MDPHSKFPELVEDLEVNIDELSESLEPLLSAPLHTTASSLPLLDRSKLYTLTAYSIESLLFSTLQASGVNAKEHAIFPELARLKQYFAKIKEIEERSTDNKQRMRLDVGATQRFIKHGLAGNDRHDLDRAERQAKERARAQSKAQQINKKFDDQGEEVKEQNEAPKKRTVEEVATREESENREVLDGSEEPDAHERNSPAPKKVRVEALDVMEIDPAPSSSLGQSSNTKRAGAKTKSEKGQKKIVGQTEAEEHDPVQVYDGGGAESAVSSLPKKRGRKPKQKATAVESGAADEDETQVVGQRKSKRQKQHVLSRQTHGAEEVVVPPAEAPKTRSEMFNALLDGSLAEEQKHKQKQEKKIKGRGKGK